MPDFSDLVSLSDVARAHLGLPRFDVDEESVYRTGEFLQDVEQRAVLGDVTVYGRKDCDEVTWRITHPSPISRDYWEEARIDEDAFVLMDDIKLDGIAIVDDVDGNVRHVGIEPDGLTPNCYSARTKSRALYGNVAFYRDLHLQQDQAKRLWPAAKKKRHPTSADYDAFNRWADEWARNHNGNYPDEAEARDHFPDLSRDFVRNAMKNIPRRARGERKKRPAESAGI